MTPASEPVFFCPLGQGCVDFPEIFRLLRLADYQGWLIVEQDIIADERGPMQTPLEAARQSRKFLEELLEDRQASG